MSLYPSAILQLSTKLKTHIPLAHHPLPYSPYPSPPHRLTSYIPSHHFTRPHIQTYHHIAFPIHLFLFQETRAQPIATAPVPGLGGKRTRAVCVSPFHRFSISAPLLKVSVSGEAPPGRPKVPFRLMRISSRATGEGALEGKSGAWRSRQQFKHVQVSLQKLRMKSIHCWYGMVWYVIVMRVNGTMPARPAAVIARFQML